MLGLGEAGSALAADLVRAGFDVHGFDPVRRPEAEGVARALSARDAVAGAGVVLSANTAAAALDVATEVAPALRAGALFCDLNTSAPELKHTLADAIRSSGAAFVDVALLGPVVQRGIRTPVLVSGDGAGHFAELFGPLGTPVEVAGTEPGAASGRKLLRSVFMKGLAACALESLEAGEAAGAQDWVRAEILRALDTPSAELLERLLTGTQAHARRRREEMAAAAEHLVALGVEPRIARAAEAWLEAIAATRASGRGATGGS